MRKRGSGTQAGEVAPIPRIALSRDEAAASLGIGLDSFERYVQPHIRMVRWGRLRLIPVEELRRFMGAQTKSNAPVARHVLARGEHADV